MRTALQRVKEEVLRGGGGVHNKVYIHSTQPDDNIMAKGWLVKIIIIKTFIVSK